MYVRNMKVDAVVDENARGCRRVGELPWMKILEKKPNARVFVEWVSVCDMRILWGNVQTVGPDKKTGGRPKKLPVVGVCTV